MSEQQSDKQILSDLAPASLADATVRGFLGNLGAKIPAPGGGASACFTGAISAAQGRMVVAYSLGKKNLTEHQGVLADADQRLARATTLFVALADEDARAYSYLNELERLPESDPRRSELPAARKLATDVPRSTVAAANEVLRVLESIVGKSNPHLRSDLGIAAVLASAAARSGAWNVWINARSLPEPAKAELEAEMDHAVRDAETRARAIEAACRV